MRKAENEPRNAMTFSNPGRTMATIVPAAVMTMRMTARATPLPPSAEVASVGARLFMWWWSGRAHSSST